MTDQDAWPEVVQLLLPIVLIAGLIVVVMCGVAVGDRVLRAYDRWECKQWCAPRGVANWGPSRGCECKP